MLAFVNEGVVNDESKSEKKNGKEAKRKSKAIIKAKVDVAKEKERAVEYCPSSTASSSSSSGGTSKSSSAKSISPPMAPTPVPEQPAVNASSMLPVNPSVNDQKEPAKSVPEEVQVAVKPKSVEHLMGTLKRDATHVAIARFIQTEKRKVLSNVNLISRYILL